MLGISASLCISQYRLELLENNITEKEYVYYYEVPIVAVSIFYLVDCVANFTLRGFKGVWENRPILYLEIFISALFWYTIIHDFIVDRQLSVQQRFAHLNTIFWMRNLRAFEFMSELQDYQMIVVTTKNLTKPILTKMLFLYVVYFIYAIIGMRCFGGEIWLERVAKLSPETPQYYFLMNFNCFSSGMVTLFHFMIVNNWYLTIDMYVNIMGHSVLITAYFVCFWSTIVLILLNVVLSMVLEIFSSVEPEVSRNIEKINMTKQMKKFVDNVIKEQDTGAVSYGEEFRLIRS